jgi:aldehyde dehydrogenase (NAD+)
LLDIEKREFAMTILKKLHLHASNPGAYSGYTWKNTPKTTFIESINPSTQTTIAEVATATLEDYQAVMQRLQQSFLIWRNTPAPKRGEIIRQMGDALRAHKDELGSLVSMEMGKSKQEGDGEVQEMIDMADFAVGQSRMLYGNTMHSERPMHRMYEQWHPVGVVGVISAFNFPVAVWAWNAFLAAICGNVTLWKPSSKTPLCAIAVHQICAEVLRRNHCPDIFGLIIPDSHDVANAMVDDSRIPLISFTGSTSVGRAVATKVASRLGRSILELGGNNAILVDPTADLNLAIRAIVFGAVGTAGQRCTTTRRLLVHQSIYDKVIDLLRHAYQQISIGSPLDPQYLMGPLVDEQAVKAFQHAVSRAKSAGGHVIFGGDVLPGPGYYVQPTLITGLSNDCALVQAETFAPILYVMPFESMDDAIRMHNSVPQGLSSALFTENLKAAEYFLSASGSDCGIANINIGTSGAEIGGAFGGEKETGGGRESGSDAWKAYMRRQTNTINWGDELPLAQGITFNLG